MAIDSLIPRRPQCIESKLTVLEKNCIEYAVAFSARNEEAFLLFHPEYLTADKKLSREGKRQCNDFFNYSKNKDYREAYTAYLKEHLGDGAKKKAGLSPELSDERIDNAFKAFLLQALEDVENGKVMDNETFKILMELFKKLGRFKDDVETQVKPIRVIMELCKHRCRYRAFVETLKTESRIFDDCEYCRARAFAEEHGFVYDPCKLLDVPQDVIDELDNKNDIQLEEILNGKIEN